MKKRKRGLGRALAAGLMALALAEGFWIDGLRGMLLVTGSAAAASFYWALRLEEAEEEA